MGKIPLLLSRIEIQFSQSNTILSAHTLEHINFGEHSIPFDSESVIFPLLFNNIIISIIIIIIISVMELGHLLARSGLTYPEVSSKVYHDSLCQLGSSISLPWVIYFETFYLHVVSSFSCIPVICPKLVLFLTPLQFVHLYKG